MDRNRHSIRRFGASLLLAALVLAGSLGSRMALAHCDSLDGPVVTDARQALESGEVTVVLKWVPAQSEDAVRRAFDEARAVRELSPQARELADTYFFETVVRLHRAGEGEPYTGLRPRDTPIDPIIAGADEALEAGSVDALSAHLADTVVDSLSARFRRVRELRTHMHESVEAGREHVAAYVEFVHYAERIASATGGTDPGESPAASGHHHP